MNTPITTPTHRVTILVNQEQISQLGLFLMEMNCAYTITPMTEVLAQVQNQGRSAGTAQGQKGLGLRILRAATANGSKGIHRKTITQIGQQAGAPPSLVQSTVTALVESGKLTSAGRGIYKRAA